MLLPTSDGILIVHNVLYGNRSIDDAPKGLLTPGQFTGITCVLAFAGIVGLVLNSVTFLVFVAVPCLRCPTNLFIMAVLLCDIVMSTVGIPFEAVSSIYNRWVFGVSGCSWHGFLMSFLGYTSIYLLTAISVERYLLITNPLSRPLITTPRAIGVIFGCVTLALLLAGFPLVGWSSYTLEAALVSCSVNWQSNSSLDVSYIVTVFVLGLLVPVGIMAYAYYKVFLTVHSLAQNQIWGKTSHVTKRNIKMEYRTTRNILLVIGTFLLCWTPYAAVSLWSAFGNPRDISPLSGTVPSLIAKSSVVWNPLVYVLTNKQFRTRVSSLFPCHLRQPTSNDTQECALERVEMKLLSKSAMNESTSPSYHSLELSRKAMNLQNSHYICVGNGLGSSCSSSIITLTVDNPGMLTPV